MYLKAAQTGDATVRLMDGAVRRTATAERTPVTEFAHAVLDGDEGCAGHIATFKKMVAALSPVKDEHDYRRRQKWRAVRS